MFSLIPDLTVNCSGPRTSVQCQNHWEWLCKLFFCNHSSNEPCRVYCTVMYNRDQTQRLNSDQTGRNSGLRQTDRQTEGQVHFLLSCIFADKNSYTNCTIYTPVAIYTQFTHSLHTVSPKFARSFQQTAWQMILVTTCQQMTSINVSLSESKSHLNPRSSPFEGLVFSLSWIR